MIIKLTHRQSEILSFIQQFTSRSGFPPSVREIMTAFGFGSTNGVICHLTALEKKGAIKRDECRSRSLTIPRGMVRFGGDIG